MLKNDRHMLVLVAVTGIIKRAVSLLHRNPSDFIGSKPIHCVDTPVVSVSLFNRLVANRFFKPLACRRVASLAVLVGIGCRPENSFDSAHSRSIL